MVNLINAGLMSGGAILLAVSTLGRWRVTINDRDAPWFAALYRLATGLTGVFWIVLGLHGLTR